MRPRRAGAWVMVGALLAGADARADVIAGDDLPGEHRAIVVRQMSPGAELGAVAGRSPGPEYPSGTVIVAWSHIRNGPMLTEWDVARRRVVRKMALGWTQAGVRVARWGDRLAIVAYAYHSAMGEIGWALLDAGDWRTLATGSLGPGMRPFVTVDGSLLAVHFEDPDPVWRRLDPGPPPRAQSHFAVLDHSGHVAALWSVPREGEGSWHPTVALLGSDVYVLEDRDGKPSRLLKLNPSRPDQRTALAYGGEMVVAQHDHLFLFGPEVFELTPDLQLVRRIHDTMWSSSIAADGSVVSDDGWVRSPSFQPRARIRSSHPWVQAEFWVGDTPFLLSTIAEPGTVGYLSWLDADIAHRDRMDAQGRPPPPPPIVIDEGPAFGAMRAGRPADDAAGPRAGDAGASAAPSPFRGPTHP